MTSTIASASHSDYSENTLVEGNAIALFADLGWETVNGFHESFGEGGTLGREHKGEVVLLPRLRAALERLNPGASREAIDLAIEELRHDRASLSLANANREVYALLKDGVRVQVRDKRGSGNDETVTLRVIDWRTPATNDFLLVSQLWVQGETYTRRPDLVGFVNGLPLVVVELKAVDVPVRDAFDHNLRDYRDTIPQLFGHNALLIVSNGHRSRIGSITSAWEHFAEWNRVASEDEPKTTGLDTLLRGTCDPARLLDLVESFTLFSESDGRVVKLLGKNHQVLGVNNAVDAMTRLGENRGRLGVFWHTQGSGKSFSMVFFSQKVQRTLPGNWTFVIVTDRQELDEQIYRTFASTGAVTEPEDAVHAGSGEHLRRLLGENHRTVFTLIQKFNARSGQPFPVLSERDDIIVMTDEAHRSQYDVFAMNMRRALPNAAFIGFTGTPLIAGAGEERTKEVFGDYVSVYNFRDSIEDGATVPLYYENRIPELQIVNDQLNEEMAELIEQAGLDEDELEALEREFRREYHLITDDDRLDTIAADIVAHFTGRGLPGQAGKAMVVSLDKATAVRMYEGVQQHWTRLLDDLRSKVPLATPEERDTLTAQVTAMEGTDMAVVVSQAQNEVEDFRTLGLDIAPHRRRMIREDLAEKFKDPDDPFRIVFVCAMWMTGFDAPSVSTIYLDKPLRNHTLMQTIARANRVFPGKLNGLIVDYIGVFRDLQRALAIYGSASGGGIGPGDSPVQDKDALIEELRAELADLTTFCRERGIDAERIAAAPPDAKLPLLSEAVDALLVNDETRREYLARARVARLRYQAILPDASAAEFLPLVTVFAKVAGMIQAEIGKPDISHVLENVGDLLDRSISSEGYVINEPVTGYDERLIDLAKIDFDALRTLFATGRRNLAAQKLRSSLEQLLQTMVERNPSRMDYLEQLQAMIEEYNTGSQNVQLFFDALMALASKLSEEDQRHIAEGLSEEELAIFDLLTRPNPGLSPKEEDTVRKVARSLLETLKREQLVLDWRKRQQARSAVRVAIEKVLDDGLPKVYDANFRDRCDKVYEHIFERYADAHRTIYTHSAA